MNILAHINASAQGNFSPPGSISKHFVRIFTKYVSFSRLYFTVSCLKTRNGALHLREMPN
jgi:hypothetical protein